MTFQSDYKNIHEGVIMDDKIKILWLSPYQPVNSDRTAGGHTFRTYYNTFKNDEKFDVRLITKCHYKQINIIREQLSPFQVDFVYRKKLKDILLKHINIESKYNWFNRYANMVSNLEIIKLKQILNKYKLEEYSPDIVIIEWTEWILLADIIKKYYPTAKIVASEHDVTFIGYERKREYYSGIEKIRWDIKYKIEKRREIDALKICDLVLPHNPDNIDVLVKNGIDKDKIKWLVPAYNDLTVCKRTPNKKDILFFGAMSRPENYLSALFFIDEVMPLLSELDIRFIILGNNPPQELKERQNERIIVTGFVDTIVPYFEKCMCMVAPLILGAGIKVKIIEAFFAGIPVLTNEIGIEGIHAKNRKDFLFCKTPQDYADAIKLAVGTGIESIGTSGKKYAIKNFNIKNSIENYKKELIKLHLKQ